MSINQQPIEKRSTDYRLQVHSVFPTIQGEGPFSGQRAVFIRLAGCNLRCPNCDTNYTSKRVEMTPQEIVAKVEGFHKTGLVVITGGEPFRQELRYLFDDLIDAGFYIQVETNGSLPLPLYNYETDPDCYSGYSGIYIVCSPKSGKIDSSLRDNVFAFKYVLHANAISEDDGLPTDVLGTGVKPARSNFSTAFSDRIYIQPEDSGDPEQNKRNLKACVESAMKFGYTMQVQLHKIAEIE